MPSLLISESENCIMKEHSHGHAVEAGLAQVSKMLLHPDNSQHIIPGLPQHISAGGEQHTLSPPAPFASYSGQRIRISSDSHPYRFQRLSVSPELDLTDGSLFRNFRERSSSPCNKHKHRFLHKLTPRLMRRSRTSSVENVTQGFHSAPVSRAPTPEPGDYDSSLLGSPNGVQLHDSISNTTDTSAHDIRHQPRSRDRRPPSSLEVPAPGGPSSGTSPAVVQNGRADTMEENDTTEDDELMDGVEVQCAGHEHNGFTSLDDVFNIPVDRLFEFIFTDSPLYRDFIAARKTFEFVSEPWPDQPNPNDGNKLRNISYTLSLNYSIGPKTSPTTETQTWFGAYSKPGSTHVIDTEVVNGGVPYSDNFYVINRYCITRVTNNRSRLRITSQIKYRKNCWGLVKRMLDKAAHEGIHSNFSFLGEFLHKEGERASNAAAGQLHNKKKVLKRRHRNTASERRSEYIANHSHTKHAPEHAPSHHPAKEFAKTETQTGLNVDLLVKVMCFMLMLLVFFNGVLYFKLLSLEQQATKATTPSHYRDTQFTHQVPKTAPVSSEEWLKLLEQQEQLHDAELARWQDILSSSATLLEHMKQSLNQLKTSLEERRGWHHYSRQEQELTPET